ncbi:pyruvate kinase [Corynebacterium yudongzhengii]|uniref:pyruvate kinase n=1 Tax=Corynebacterium yudongzhengii TaxID=2080740 RepID=A0A2U1T811_9CORY|nr:pyruvate kinase [Corynebacterium yudongzhengii]AWB82803.1 pyruvate kinase [Corynebacterium yudongzhengii]PWC02137.1 pyruvate kinase [Corynebacterium yudongzhengii]
MASRMDENLRAILEQIDTLLEDLETGERENTEAIERVHPDHREGARNLVHYATLRSRDMRPLQANLASLGATRLTTTEPAVKARLQAARNVVSAYLGEELKFGGDDVFDAFSFADDLLEGHADSLLGPNAPDTHSRIMVTLPTEAADDPQLVLGFAEAGMEIARINCAKDTEAEWLRMIDNVHAAAERVGREIRIAMDLAGPKLRTGEIAPGPAIDRARVTRTDVGEMITPAKLWFIPRGAVADGADWPEPPELPGRPTLSVLVDDTWAASLAEGAKVRFVDTRDAKREFEVEAIHEVDGVRCALALGQQNAYLSNSTLIEYDWVKTRVGGIKPSEQELRFEAGDEMILTTEQIPTDPRAAGTPVVACTLVEAAAAINVGERVLFDDGTIEAVCRGTDTDDAGHHRAHLEVTRTKPGGSKLKASKGINLPETDLPLPSLTDEDIAAFEFVARHGDIANVSFIRNAEDVAFVLDTLEKIADTLAREEGPESAERARDLGIVLKIETIPAYEQLAAVLLEGMRHRRLGLMIARGDLAVEFGFERLAEVPRLIMNMAEAAHVPTIMATQVLENLAKNGLPSRAEITDAAYALRAEAVMLNKGPHITEAIAILNSLSSKLGASQRKNRMQLRRIKSWQAPADDAVNEEE